MSEFVNIAAYKFVELSDLSRRRERLLKLSRRHSLRGTILLSREGINLFVAGRRDAVDSLLRHLKGDELMADLKSKESLSDTQPFNRMLVKVKKEIIPFGVDGIEPSRNTSRRISPTLLKNWLDDDRPIVLLDVRNDFEFELGSFEGAVTAGTGDFRSFPRVIARLPEEMKHRTVVTFCTGGIRCEKAAPLLEQNGFTDVYQLDGGILSYFEECGSAHYRGECYVFDKRVALDGQLQESSTTQCFACHALLAPADRQSPQYVEGVSCPSCFESDERRLERLLDDRHTALEALVRPLPGSRPYENVRPIHVTRACDGLTALEFLSTSCRALTADQWCHEIGAARVLIAGVPIKPSTAVRAGQRLCHMMPDTKEPDVDGAIRIIHEDSDLLVCHKPAPLPVHPCGRFNRNTLSWILGQVYAPLKLRLVHRLDANTTGIVVLAKTRRTAAQMHAQFAAGEVSKRYVAELVGRVDQPGFSSTTRIGRSPANTGARLPDDEGMESRTDFAVVGYGGNGTTMVRINPLTGRTNQIRLHAWERGHPVVGDPMYLPQKRLGASQTLSPGELPMRLHASEIEFNHPASGRRMSFRTSVPKWWHRSTISEPSETIATDQQQCQRE